MSTRKRSTKPSRSRTSKARRYVSYLCYSYRQSPGQHVVKLLEEYGIDFRFLLDNLLVEKPKDPSRPPPFRSHPEKTQTPIHTPASTPVRSRSPAVPTSTPSRTRTPAPAMPPLPPPSSMPTLALPTPVSASPSRSPSRMRSPVPPPRTASAASFRSQTPTGEGNPLIRPPRGSPAPPPRSRDRPGSATGHPPPVELPRRQGMF